jgi:uroporphyrinogen III methyltransferase/synthase
MTRQDPSHPGLGKVYLVSAGPGDPGLMTLRGAQCLRQAEVVLYDDQVDSCILAHATPSAELVCVGPDKGCSAMSPEAIRASLIDAARRGKIVVRLKGGDSAVFGPAADETAALAHAAIPYEVVPGVTAGLAAADYAGIPIAQAGNGSAVALVTGHEHSGEPEPSLDYEALARFPGTLLISTGLPAVQPWCEALIGHGKSPQTPVAVIRHPTRPGQEICRTTLGDLSEVIRTRRLHGPAIVVVGEAAALAPATAWFAARPLFGARVLVTRPRDQAEPLVQKLTDLGAEVLVQPAIRISGPLDGHVVDAALARLDEYDWLVFSSANGVRYLLERLWATNGDLRRLGRVKLAAIGPGTADELRKYHLRADLVPEQFRAESLAAALGQEAAGRRFLLARASRGREVLPEQLAAAGGRVEQIVVYSSADVERADPEVARRLAVREVDWITVTSSSIARSLVTLFGEDLRKSRLASISPVTSETLRQLGYPPAAEAGQYTVDGLVRALVAESSEKDGG